MKDFVSRRWEGFLIRLAAWILNRNVARSGVTSRRDNNWIFDVQFELPYIAERIERGYPDSDYDPRHPTHNGGESDG